MKKSEFHVNTGHTIAETVIPISYKNSGEIKTLSSIKLSNYRQMFDKFISPERRMPLLD